MRLKSKKGQAAVEFTLIFPLLLILVFGIVEFGLLLYNKAVITNASREGARFGIVSRAVRYNENDIRPVVENYCVNHMITFGESNTPTVTAVYGAQTFGNPLTVEVDWSYKFLVLPSFTGINNTVNMKAVTVMKYE